jgi:hypothetical protein
MQSSQLNSLTISPVGSRNPATVAKAATVPLRVVVTNVGPVIILLAHEDGTLINAPAFASTYQLLPGKELTVVLVPRQGLFAAGIGAGGQLSAAISEAIPTKWMEA